MRLSRVLGASAIALLFAASLQPQQTAVAQGMMQQTQAAPPPVRVRATVEKIDGGVLTVKTRDGTEMKLKLADSAPVNEIVKASLADVKPGAYVAVTGMPQPDGSQKALAVFIFAEAQRGLAEGYRPWDFAPNSTMTNATVDNQVAGVQGQTLTVKYKDGEQKVLVTPATEITAATKKSAADLKPGQKISVFAAKKLPDGTLEAPNLSFGDYGVWR
ncbi:MAG TPA: DUF5666 domain-containing protein [Xanthobacteraceae bacterium]|nr:DUF5666 domain-containing protein [Xanthobacteraceae bacterium]